MPDLIILIGAPGVGKSKWVEDFTKKSPNWYYIVSSDNIIMEMAKSFNITDYNKAFKQFVVTASRIAREDGELYLLHGYNVIWDQTNMTLKDRKVIFNILEKHKISGYTITGIAFELQDKEHERRLKLRLKENPTKIIPKEAIDKMLYSYDKPTKKEGFYKLTFIKK